VLRSSLAEWGDAERGIFIIDYQEEGREKEQRCDDVCKDVEKARYGTRGEVLA